MAESSQHPPPPGDPDGGARPGDAPGQLRALSAALAIAAGSAILGIAGGLIWAAIAPQAQFVVASRGVAYVVNPETSAFIAADGWYSAVAVAGGVIIGLAAYLLGVRRFGPLPAAGALAGATAPAFLAWWVGRSIGLAAFRHRLEISKPGALIRQPADLGAHGALALWPLAAGVVIGGIELALALRERRRHPPVPLAGSGRHRSPGHYRSRDERDRGGDEQYRSPGNQDRGPGEANLGPGDGPADQQQAGRNSDQLDG